MTTLTKSIKPAAESSPLMKAEVREAARPDVAKTHFVVLGLLKDRSFIRAIGFLKEPRSLMAADGLLQPIVDLSSIGRNGAAAVGGVEWISYDPSIDLSQPLMGLTLATFLVSATAQTVEAIKKYNYADKIGDAEGKRLALASMGITIPLAGSGGAALLQNSLRVYDLAQTLQNVNYQPVAEVSQSISILGTVTLALFGLYNAVMTAIAAFNLYQKYQIKKEIGNVASVRDWLDAKLKSNIAEEVKKHSENEFVELALEEGEKWLAKLEKDWAKLAKDWQKLSEEEKNNNPLEIVPINVRDKAKRKELIEKLFQNDDMAAFTGIPDKKGQDLIIAFGQKLMTDRLRTREEQKLSRTIGQAIIDKYNTTTGEITSKELMSEIDKGMNQNRWLIFLGALGLIICVSALVFTGGIGALCVSLMFVLSAVLWIYGWDGNRLINQWNGEQTGKFDKVMLVFSSLLNIVAVAGTIASMIVFTGGVALVPLTLLVLVGLFWAVVNVRGIYTYARHSSRPWEYEKIVSLGSFHKLVQTKAKADEIDKYFKKMSDADQDFLRRIEATFSGQKEWKDVVQHCIDIHNSNRIAQLKNLNSYARASSA